MSIGGSPEPVLSKKKRIRLEEEVAIEEEVAVSDIEANQQQQQLTPIIQSCALASTCSKNSNPGTAICPLRLDWNHQAHELSSSSRSNTAGAMFAPGLSDLARRKKLKKK
jgi:hypothetical protein